MAIMCKHLTWKQVTDANPVDDVFVINELRRSIELRADSISYKPRGRRLDQNTSVACVQAIPHRYQVK